MTYLGMIFIISGWLLQLARKGKEMNKNFILVYSVGVLLLVIDQYRIGSYLLGTLNLLSCSVAMAVFFKSK